MLSWVAVTPPCGQRHRLIFLQDKLGHMAGVPSLFIMGGADEFVPDAVDKGALVKRLAAAVGSSATPVLVPNGKHNLTGSENELADIVVDFLGRL